MLSSGLRAEWLATSALPTGGYRGSGNAGPPRRGIVGSTEPKQGCRGPPRRTLVLMAWGEGGSLSGALRAPPALSQTTRGTGVVPSIAQAELSIVLVRLAEEASTLSTDVCCEA